MAYSGQVFPAALACKGIVHQADTLFSCKGIKTDFCAAAARAGFMPGAFSVWLRRFLREDIAVPPPREGPSAKRRAAGGTAGRKRGSAAMLVPCGASAIAFSHPIAVPDRGIGGDADTRAKRESIAARKKQME